MKFWLRKSGVVEQSRVQNPIWWIPRNVEGISSLLTGLNNYIPFKPDCRVSVNEPLPFVSERIKCGVICSYWLVSLVAITTNRRVHPFSDMQPEHIHARCDFVPRSKLQYASQMSRETHATSLWGVKVEKQRGFCWVRKSWSHQIQASRTGCCNY